ncbi:5'-nucleotidase, lipoprotein e(P4) family [Pokkaliibacter sp. CJK22405]|uniref:5'-nucleotidase, lipoprotein e(P4) family n=1 Tax=Pokkaliibacter sp. CJK22405 TaxID=3384615 RepID=UPI0039852D32
MPLLRPLTSADSSSVFSRNASRWQHLGRQLALGVGLCAGLAIAAPGFADEAMAPKAAQYTTQDLNEQLVLATLWMQASGEFRALSYQAFNLAQLRYDMYSAAHTGNRKLAVVVDADETVIDNSAFEAWLVGKDFGYSSKTWERWMAAADAKAMPGAVDFLNYVKSRGGEVFYVTNRKEVGREGTLKNLKALGFPYVDDAHLMLRTDTSNKSPRREMIAQNYDIALLMGDNLNDFSSAFDVKTLAESKAAVDAHKKDFGSRFIMLPNPTYGDWEGKVYGGNWGASAAEKDAMRKSHLDVWEAKP